MATGWYTVPHYEMPAGARGFARNADESDAPEHWRGLVGLWAPYLGGQGAMLYDVSGYGGHGVLTNMSPATDWLPGLGGVALEFDGTDDYVEVPNLPHLKPVSAITVATWCKASATPQAGTSVVQQRFSPTVDPWDSYLIGVTGDGIAWEWNISNGTAGTLSSVQTLLDTQWTHLVGTYDGTTQRLYKDGVQADSIGMTGTLGYSTMPLYIGLRTTADPTPYFNGLIREVRIYNRALSSSEVLDLYLRPHAVLRRRWPLMKFGVAVETSVASIPPDAIAASTNLSGVVAAVQDDPDAPDGTWLTASSATTATDLRVSFGTP